MSSNPNLHAATLPSLAGESFTATAEVEPPAPANDNATRGGVPDTTPLVARPEVVRSIRGVLWRHRVASQNMADAIAEVQTEAIEVARTRRMPGSLAQWKALATTIAVHWALDRLREAKVRKKYDAGLCGDPDAHVRPTLLWEHADPVDTKRYLAVLEELFDSGEMPEHGAEILRGEADDVPHADIAAAIGVSATVVDNRLFRMRTKFRARLAALGMLLLLLILAVLLPPPAARVGAAPQQAQPAAPIHAVSALDGGPPARSEIRRLPPEEVAPLPLK